MRRIFFGAALFLGSLLAGNTHAQMKAGYWKGELKRQGDMAVPVVFSYNHSSLYFINAGEKIEVVDLIFKGDSVSFAMPVFESVFKAKLIGNHKLQGEWWKGSDKGWSVWQFNAAASADSLRFGIGEPDAKRVEGKWAFDITRINGTHRVAVGEFQAKQSSVVTGTVRTPSGDYRYMDGIIKNDSLHIATFDGSHAFYMTAKMLGTDTITGGVFYTGSWPTETFTAIRNEEAVLPAIDLMSQIGDSPTALSFCFKDIDGKEVCLSDEAFQNKAVVIQLMGSWCPNCMDETAWLSEWYKANKPLDVEVLAVAFELSEDYKRSAKSLDKFRKKFDVPYPMLVSGTKVSDKEKMAKALPGLPEIDIFPTTLFLNKQKQVVAAHSGFYGPASPQPFLEFQQEFNKNLELARQKKQ